MSKKRKIQILLVVVLGIVSIAFYFFERSGAGEDAGSEVLTTMEEKEENSTEEVASIVVDVCGAVRNPSVLVLEAGSRVYEAVEATGGLREDADTRTTNLAAELSDGMKLYIPTKAEIDAEMREGGGAYVGGSLAMGGSETVSNSHNASKKGEKKVNINTANAAELQTLNRVGPAVAAKIIDYRTKYGPFKKIEDIMNVSGVGQKTFEKWKEFICVE